MDGSHDHPARKLDRPGTYLPDKVRSAIETLQRRLSGVLEGVEQACKLAAMKNGPLAKVLRLKTALHAVKSDNVFPKVGHSAIPYAGRTGATIEAERFRRSCGQRVD